MADWPARKGAAHVGASLTGASLSMALSMALSILSNGPLAWPFGMALSILSIARG